MQANSQKKWYKKWWVIVIGVLIGIIVLSLFAGKGLPVLKDIPTEVTQSVLRVNGFGVEANATVNIYLNGNLVSEIKADNDGNFTTPLTLIEGKNTLYATASYKDSEKKSSEKIITYTNQDKIDAQSKAEADARAVAQEAQQKADDEAKVALEAQTKIDAENARLALAEENKKAEVGGLGVRRDIAMGIMKICSPEYKFQLGTKQDGRENYLANENGVMVQFVGSEDSLYQIAALALLDTNDQEQVNNAFRVLGCISGTITPTESEKDWLKAEASDYLYKSNTKDYTHTKVFGKRKYVFTSTVLGSVPSVTLSVTVN